MSASTIEWTEETWNPTTGCDRTSPGCDHCYALTMAKRLKAIGQAKYQRDGDPRTSGPGFALTLHPDTLDAPLHWRRPRLVFVNSMSDLFHPAVPDAFIADVFVTMAMARHHTYQVLTKRPQRMAALTGNFDDWLGCHLDGASERRTGTIFADHVSSRDYPMPWVWLGTSIESDRYTFRADHLRATPAAVRFLSCEPLLGPLPSLDLTGIDWVIVGGESGRGARPMHPDWVRGLRDLCVDAGVAFFFKQWGEYRYVAEAHAVGEIGPDRWPRRKWECLDIDGTFRGDAVPNADSACVQRVGKAAAGRELDGRTWDEMPERAA